MTLAYRDGTRIHTNECLLFDFANQTKYVKIQIYYTLPHEANTQFFLYTYRTFFHELNTHRYERTFYDKHFTIATPSRFGFFSIFFPSFQTAFWEIGCTIGNNRFSCSFVCFSWMQRLILTVTMRVDDVRNCYWKNKYSSMKVDSRVSKWILQLEWLN